MAAPPPPSPSRTTAPSPDAPGSPPRPSSPDRVVPPGTPRQAERSAVRRAAVREAVDAWQLPALADVPIVTSGRLRTSLGLFDPRRMEIRLAAFLDRAPAPLLREVLLHELAHAAVRLVHGPGRRPHGREWRACMAAVGLAPRVRFPRELLASLRPPGDPPARRARWRHRCPHCELSRMAGRPVRRWRCLTCARAGRDGELEITRVPPRPPD